MGRQFRSVFPAKWAKSLRNGKIYLGVGVGDKDRGGVISKDVMAAAVKYGI